MVNDTSRAPGKDHNSNSDHGLRKSSEAEMLRTYSTGILAICLAGYALYPGSYTLLYIAVTWSCKY